MLVKPKRVSKKKLSQLSDEQLFFKWVADNAGALYYFMSGNRKLFVDQMAEEICLDFDDSGDRVAVSISAVEE